MFALNQKLLQQNTGGKVFTVARTSWLFGESYQTARVSSDISPLGCFDKRPGEEPRKYKKKRSEVKMMDFCIFCILYRSEHITIQRLQ
jgi:hypothetical protein